ncbi:DUF3545 family protein [Enterovibrio norvegicus]|uniref:DUF3545 domain-containing protein n=2 Tax=Enterovibrio norvegicus TaxID=188144 RepID=A0A2N7L6K7_9GAMM|nr:DUF3545 family protein [Enterovibrio norvegicus]MCC4799728.1 DUF3545 family protein [Enterovibrio norvegicus]OEE51738.1 DUF3545 domain-containing protein [Enterovibrio norvegicus]OEF59670.1 DUF3545 domain-containing protein [Enterovibrio norvegicus]OEF64739.1 DUF3545 domain-containing protein [Enterovibrio norvegicus]PMH71121.1 DUF3545 domain-containing protein [Enterovibrio norvegicus]
MDSFAFNELFDQERPQRGGRTKQAKRKWREIEALQDRQRLRKELQDIDMLGNLNDGDFDL